MNYIREINAFYDWLELNELTKPAVLLWHALMHLNNKSGWQESFTVARSVIEAKTGLKKDAYYKARNQLKQYRLLEFKERGTKATIFRMFPVSSVLQTTIQISYNDLSVKQTTNETTTKTTSQTRTQTRTETINKLNKTKLNETNNIVAATPVNFFDEYLLAFNRQPSPIQIQEINSFIDQDGLTDEVICTAFRKAAENGAGYPYARSIINSWAKKGVKTLEAVNREQSEFESKRAQGKQRRGTATRKELLPDWFDEEEQKQPSMSVPVDLDAKKKEIEEKLKLFRAN